MHERSGIPGRPKRADQRQFDSRNRTIVELFKAGWSYPYLARKFGVSKSRIRQIVEVAGIYTTERIYTCGHGRWSNCQFDHTTKRTYARTNNTDKLYESPHVPSQSGQRTRGMS